MSLGRFTLFTAAAGLVIEGLGDAMNHVATFFNSGLMPVKAIECVQDKKFLDDDTTHMCMVASSHVKYLCDFIRVGDMVYSPGDFGLAIGWAIFAIMAPIAVYLYLKDR